MLHESIIKYVERKRLIGEFGEFQEAFDGPGRLEPSSKNK